MAAQIRVRRTWPEIDHLFHVEDESGEKIAVITHDKYAPGGSPRWHWAMSRARRGGGGGGQPSSAAATISKRRSAGSARAGKRPASGGAEAEPQSAQSTSSPEFLNA